MSGTDTSTGLSISIVGLGSMARTLAARALARGSAVELIGRDPAKAADLAAELGGGATTGKLGEVPAGELVLLAVPYEGAVPIVREYGDALAGKVIVDLTNPFDRDGFTGLLTPEDRSGAEELAAVAPAGAHVVKAFNTVFGHVLGSPEFEGHSLDVFIAGDDDGAKARVSAFAESLALRPLDTGALKMAHWLEGAGLVMMGLALRKAADGRKFSLGISVYG
jgi:hypothetical protein